MAIRDLAAHTAQFVTVAELAEYWAVSRQQIYKRIESGVLDAICLGSRLYRIRTAAALEYERGSRVDGGTSGDTTPSATPGPKPTGEKFPHRIGFQRIVRGGRN